MMQNPLELDWTDPWPEQMSVPLPTCHGGRSPATHAVMPWAEAIPRTKHPRLCGGNMWIRSSFVEIP